MKYLSNTKLLIVLSVISISLCGFDLDTTLGEFCLHPNDLTNSRHGQSATQLHNDNTVVVWQYQGADYRINAKIFSRDMKTVIKEEFIIYQTAYLSYDMAVPSIATLSNGNFIVLWFAMYSIGQYTFNILTPNGDKLSSDIIIGNATLYSTIIPLVDKFVVVFTHPSPYNAYAIIYDNSANVIKSQFQVSADATSAYILAGTVLTNGNFIVAMQNSNRLGIYATIFDPNGNQIKPDFVVSDVKTDNVVPSIAALKNDKFIIIFRNMPSGGLGSVLAQVLNNDGTPVGSQFQAVSSTYNDYSAGKVKALIYGGFLIAFMKAQIGYPTLGYQLFDNNINKIGSEIIIGNDQTIKRSTPIPISLRDNSFVVLYGGNTTTNNDIIMAEYFKYTSILSCKSFTLNGSTPITIDFTSYITHEYLQPSELYIKFITSPGSLVDSTNTDISLNVNYSSVGIKYIFAGPMTGLSFNYVSADNSATSSICTVTIAVNISCYSACATCFNTGDNTTNNCSTCVNDYYTKEDSTVNCYASNTSVPGYYFSSTIFKKCYISCNQCTSLGNTTSMSCSSCANSYYPLEDNSSQCYSSSVPGYFLNTDRFTKCLPSCQDCTGLGNSTDQKCSSCANSYYPLEDNTSQCYFVTDSVNGYYFNNKFSKCYQTCKSCTTAGTLANNQCTSCISDYYPLEDNMSQCISTNQNIDYYFKDTSNSRWSKCYQTCKTCSATGTATNNNCLTCTSGYNPDSNPSQCTNTSPTTTKCYDSCGSCKLSGDAINNKCSTCASGYYPLEDNSSQCLAPNLNKTNYFWDKTNSRYSICYQSCGTCSASGTASVNNCLTCNSNYYPLDNNDSQCNPPNSIVAGYFWDPAKSKYSSCYTSCSLCKTAGNSLNNNCQTCNTGYYPLSDDSSEYYPPNTQIDNYTWDATKSKYTKCYFSCSNNTATNNTVTFDSKYYDSLVADITSSFDKLSSNTTLLENIKIDDLLKLADSAVTIINKSTMGSNSTVVQNHLNNTIDYIQGKLENLTDTIILKQLNNGGVVPNLSYEESNIRVTISPNLEGDIMSSAKSMGVNLKGCFEKVRKILALSTTDPIPLRKIEYTNKLSSTSFLTLLDPYNLNKSDIITSNTIDIVVFNPKTNEKLNLIDYCPKEIFNMTFPSVDGVNYALYTKYKLENIDIYYKNSSFFTDRCFAFYDTVNLTDVPVSKRREHIGDVIIECGAGCKYEGISADEKVICNCLQPRGQVEVVKVLSTLVSNNFLIVTCFPQALKDIKNVQFNSSIYTFSAVLLLCIAVIVIQLLRERKIDNIKPIIDRFDKKKTITKPKVEADYQKVDNQSNHVNPDQIKIETAVTYHPQFYTPEFTPGDCRDLSAKEIVENDKRPWYRYILDLMLVNCTIMSVFFFYSVYTPTVIRVSMLLLQIALDCLFNALLYTDDLIYERVNNSSTVIL
jgi:hypothetical protein